MPNDKDVVNSESKIEGDLPEPTISGTPTGQPLDQAGDSSVTLEAVEQLLDKRFQSMKDTRLGKMETKLTDMEGTISKYEALQSQGLSKDQAKVKMQGDQELGDIKSQLASLLEGKAPEALPGGSTQGWKERRASILTDAGIDGSDSRFVDFMKQEFASHDDMNDKLFKATEEWSFTDETKPKPDSSTITQVIASTPVVGDDYKGLSDDELGARYEKLAKEPTKNKAEMDKVIKAIERRDKIKE